MIYRDIREQSIQKNNLKLSIPMPKSLNRSRGETQWSRDDGNVPAIEERLKSLITNDPSVINTSLREYSDLDSLDNSSILKRMETLDKCFSHDTVEEIIDVLDSEATETNDGWYGSVLKNLKYASPLSLKVSLRSIREGRYQTLDECLIREYRLTSRAISCQISSDFCEGVRARMVDKDYAPKWDPPSLEHVSKDMVEQYFSPLSPFEHELEFPALQVATYKAMGTRYHAAETNFKAKMLRFCVLRIM
nr:3-hydroxyisobutyryl-CoA hydrolase-like protein 1, mitochondrial [Tanacetum cinerariifolium]